MSVSTGGEVNVDLRAVVEGGDAFFKRLSDLQTAKMGAEDAIAKLGVAQNVNASVADANAKVVKATQVLTDADKAAKQIVDDANAKAESITAKARAEAQSILDAAKAKADDLTQGAQKFSDGARAEAQKVLAAAKASKLAADKLLSEHQAKAQLLASKQEEARILMESAQSIQKEFSDKLAAIQTAAAAVLK